MIRVKDLSIHEDATSKENTGISYDAFQADKIIEQVSEIAEINKTLKQKRGRSRKEDKLALITMLTDILLKPQWQPTANVFHVTSDLNDSDLYILLVKHLEKIQTYSPETFAFVTQFDIVDPVIYKAAINGQFAEKWLAAAVIEYNQLIENRTGDKVLKSEILIG